MIPIGYHASHEQFAPSRLLRLVRLAEEAGFDAAKSSDHFHPWSERQGQSGFAWSWMGAALQATRFPVGLITAPGYRYHPAVVAQGAATLGEMFPGRLWLALGSGEAVNEAITGQAWPDKPERNARLRECVDVIRALLRGETVTHRGRITVVEARLYTRPSVPVPLFGAAMTEDTARFAGGWADGLLVAGNDPAAARGLVTAFREGGGEGKPVHLQLAVCCAATVEAAEAEALREWGPASIGGEVNYDLRRPADFARAAQTMDGATIRNSVVVTADLAEIAELVGRMAAAGIAAVHLHHVGTAQEDFIEACGRDLLPRLRE